ncbi:MAG: protein kinase domain-containing protein [Planctomycetota bacterium]
MNPRLRVEVGRQANFEYEIPPAQQEEDVWLGRGAFCKIRISDPQLSRRHCEFSYKDGRLFVEDLGSRNGTRVNGDLIESRVELNDGDSVIVGSHELRVILPSPAAEEEAEKEEAEAKGEVAEVNLRMAELKGSKFADYKLGEIVFNGDASVIYRARDEDSGRTVAVKVLKPLSSISVEDQNRFIRGAKHSANLSHPNFVRVFKGGRYKEWYYIAMEYVRGLNLEQVLERKGDPLDLDPAVEIMRQVLQALQHAYEQDIVFRALRPDNLIVREGLRIKITDFDLVKPLTGRQEAQVTRVMDGSLRVEPDFAAPELIAYPVVADQKADVFGAGALLYFMLCAKAPFGDLLPGDKKSSAFDRKVQHPREINHSIPEPICQVISRAMSDYERYNTPQEMLDALEQVAAEL